MPERQDLDAELMLRFQAGEVACFEELVERHKQRVFNLVYRFLGGRQDAEDLAQEVFLRVYRSKADYRPTARFTTWLYVISRNVCLKAVQKSRHDLAAQRDDPQFAQETRARRGIDEAGLNPLHAAIRDEQAEMVRKAVMALPEAQRMVVILFRYEHLDYEEIAQVTQNSVSGVKSLLHRAKVGLKERLSGLLRDSAQPGPSAGIEREGDGGR